MAIITRLFRYSAYCSSFKPENSKLNEHGIKDTLFESYVKHLALK